MQKDGKGVNSLSGRGKTICFIDNSNIFAGQLDNNWRIDWVKFYRKIERDGPIWQTYFFASENDQPRDVQSDFYNFLKSKLRWEIELYGLGMKATRCNFCGKYSHYKTEKGVDVGLATKMLILGVNRSFDTAVLVSGDRDYLETVKYIKSLGLRVEIIAWRRSLSNEMEKESSAPVIYLDNLKAEIERTPYSRIVPLEPGIRNNHCDQRVAGDE